MRFFGNSALTTTVSLALLLLMGLGMTFFYLQLSSVRATLAEVQQKKEAVAVAVKENPLDDSERSSQAKSQRWSIMQGELKDTVAQVFAQRTEFNWLEPYKTPNQSESAGSAFFINDEGELITNAHVVEQAIYIAIQIPALGKRRLQVDVIGISPDRDLALLRLKKNELETLRKELKVKSLPFLKLGDSDAVKRGDKLMTLGYPLGQQGLKSTTGVVSGREHLPMAGYYIQISAPINKGNSGGPSLDSNARVIGVNSAGIPGAQNVGYIIPINEVVLFLEQLSTMPEGKSPKLLQKPFLGVFFNNGSENLTAFLKNPPPGGLYVVDVYKGSPFDKAGIKAGDMIYKIDNHPIDIYGEMVVPWDKEERISIIDYVARLKMDHQVNLEYYRNGSRKTATFKLARTEPPIRRMYPGYEKIDYEVIAGFVFMPITINHVIMLGEYAPSLVQYADVKKQIEPALLITHLMLNSTASRARTIGAGGIIAEVNGKRVKTLEDLRAAVPLSAKTGYLTIKTTDNQFAALPLHEIIEDEPRLSSTYFYPLSDSYKELVKQAGKK